MYAILTKGTYVDRKIDNTPDFASLADAEVFIRDRFAAILLDIEIDAANDAIDFVTTIGGIYAVEKA
jgi:hypothetical protein